MTSCSFRDRHLRTKHGNVNVRTWVKQANSGWNKKERSKGGSQGCPRVAVRVVQEYRSPDKFVVTGTAEIKLGQQSAGQGWDQRGWSCGVTGAGTKSHRLREAEMGSLAHWYAWEEALGRAGQGQKAYWYAQRPDKSHKCCIWYFRLRLQEVRLDGHNGDFWI